eukprot:m51a1_g11965 hypothetical protein (619) ;mRNA; f:806500-809125
MKGLQWTKLPPKDIAGTIFSKFKNLEAINIPVAEMEKEFGQKKAAQQEESAGTFVERRKACVQILDSKVGQNISILLKGIKGRDVNAVIGGIQNLDESMFDPGLIGAIIKSLPSKEDVLKIEEFLKTRPITELGIAEKFALELGRITQVDVKLAAFSQKLAYQGRLQSVRENIATLRTACEQVLGNSKMVEVMSIILMLGNFLNSGTNRAGVTAFKIAVLGKLADLKTMDGKRTFMQYLVTYCAANFPELCDFASELTGVGPACTPAGNQIESDIAALAKSVKDVETALSTVQQSKSADSEAFIRLMTEFVERAQEDLRALQEEQRQTSEAYLRMVRYLGEDPSNPPSPEELLQQLKLFVDHWEAAAKENARQRQQTERETKRKIEVQKTKEVERKRANTVVEEQHMFEDIITDPETPEKRRERAAALACALHPRLGAPSPAGMLPQDVMRDIVKLSFARLPVSLDSNTDVFVAGDWLMWHEGTSFYMQLKDATVTLRFYDDTNGWFEVRTSSETRTVWSETSSESFAFIRPAAPVADGPRPTRSAPVVEAGAGSVRRVSPGFVVTVSEGSVRVEMAGDNEVLEVDIGAPARATFRGDRTSRDGLRRGLVDIFAVDRH